jgi:hypothetical protein
MLELLKRLLGTQKKSRRPWLDLEKLNAPVDAARQRLEATQAAHAATIEKYREHAATLSVAKASFETYGNDETADSVVELSGAAARHDLFKARALRVVDRATSELAEAEAKRDTAALVALDSIHSNAWTHIQAEWAATGKPALATFGVFLVEVDTILAEAEAAMREAARMRGDDTAWAKQRALEALGNVLTDLIARELTVPVVDRISHALTLNRL